MDKKHLYSIAIKICRGLSITAFALAIVACYRLISEDVDSQILGTLAGSFLALAVFALVFKLLADDIRRRTE